MKKKKSKNKAVSSSKMSNKEEESTDQTQAATETTKIRTQPTECLSSSTEQQQSDQDASPLMKNRKSASPIVADSSPSGDSVSIQSQQNTASARFSPPASLPQHSQILTTPSSIHPPGYGIVSIFPTHCIFIQQPGSINSTAAIPIYSLFQQNGVVMPGGNTHPQQPLVSPSVSTGVSSIPMHSRPHNLPAASSTTPSVARRPTPLATPSEEEKCFLLSLHMDEDYLSDYQCLVRKQIELFVAAEKTIHESAQGRNRPICLGQVGIRCRHCGRLAAHKRGKGAVYFPSRLLALYQTAQNMANTHLVQECSQIPEDIRRRLLELREGSLKSKSSHGGGRQYWAQGLRAMGVVESSDHRLRIQGEKLPG